MFFQMQNSLLFLCVDVLTLFEGKLANYAKICVLQS